MLCSGTCHMQSLSPLPADGKKGNPHRRTHIGPHTHALKHTNTSTRRHITGMYSRGKLAEENKWLLGCTDWAADETERIHIQGGQASHTNPFTFKQPWFSFKKRLRSGIAISIEAFFCSWSCHMKETCKTASVSNTNRNISLWTFKKNSLIGFLQKQFKTLRTFEDGCIPPDNIQSVSVCQCACAVGQWRIPLCHFFPLF